MGSKKLKGLVIKIGGDTSELSKALDNVEKRGENLSSELGQINKLLKLDPTNTELLAQKQKVLAEAINNTESKLDTLREAEKQVQAQFERGEVSEAQYRELQREIIATENKLIQYKNAVKETAEAEKKLAEGANDAANELENQADKTEIADQSIEELDDSASDLAVGGLAAMAAAAVAAVTAIVALAESTREYRTEMAKLNTAFKDSNFSAETATKTYESLQGVLGETDQAVEASSLLAKMCSTEQELADWTEILTGVYGTFGASLPVEGLAEAANETARVGQVTGPLADALNWAAESGEDFGVMLKENIEFTKLDKKELAKLTDAQRAEYEAREKQYNEIQKYNIKVSEAVSAEDKFNIALENCADAQERQQLITSTLTQIYGSAAQQYRETNAEVIRANEATEKWNKATAKIGKTVEPVVTDIKELGASLLEDMEEPLTNIANFIQQKVLPAIKAISSWAKSNGPLIKGVLVGVTTAMVAYKVATVAATVSQKGLKGAIMATTVAQKALNLVQSATPWGLVLAGVTAVIGGLVAYKSSSREAAEETSEFTEEISSLTEKDQALVDKTKELSDAIRDQSDATQEAMLRTSAEMESVQKLADELIGLADSSGRVQEKDQARADFILGRLNEALSTEYQRVGDVIQQYDELSQSIEEVIQKKLANALLEEGQDAYYDAQTKILEAMIAATDAEKAYQEQLAKTEEAQRKVTEAQAEYDAALFWKGKLGSKDESAALEKAKEEAETAKKALVDLDTARQTAAANFESYKNTIIDYETAITLAAEGNYEAVKAVLVKKSEAYTNYGDQIGEDTSRVIEKLELDALLAGDKAAQIKSNFEEGVEGFTEEWVKEAEEGYKEALSKFATAYSDAHGLGRDFGQGLADGITSQNGIVAAAAIEQIKQAVAAQINEAEINSPSKKTMKVGSGLGEGVEVGIDGTTPNVQRSAREQIAAVIDAYQTPPSIGQRTFRSIAEQQSAKYAAGQTPVVADNGPMLERILGAIEKGQVLMLDGDAVVGGTAAKMDNALGRRRALASRGAL